MQAGHEISALSYLNLLPDPRNCRENFDAILSAMIERPTDVELLVRRLDADFGEERAVMVLDMSGFSRTTEAHGIAAFIAMIYRMRQLAAPVIVANSGTLVKAIADNLYCLFRTVADAVAAARGIIRVLDAANVAFPADRQLYASIGIGWGRVLNIGGEDIFGCELNHASKLGEDIADTREILVTDKAMAVLREPITVFEREIAGIRVRYGCVALEPAAVGAAG